MGKEKKKKKEGISLTFTESIQKIPSKEPERGTENIKPPQKTYQKVKS